MAHGEIIAADRMRGRSTLSGGCGEGALDQMKRDRRLSGAIPAVREKWPPLYVYNRRFALAPALDDLRLRERPGATGSNQ